MPHAGHQLLDTELASAYYITVVVRRPRWSYRILYKLDDDTVIVIAIFLPWQTPAEP